MTDAKTLAKYLLALMRRSAKVLPPEEFDVTALKLMKLMYYCQGYSLALRGLPLFDEDFVGTQHGPVIPDVLDGYKQYLRACIPNSKIPNSPDELNIDEDTAAIVRLVVREKGDMSNVALAFAIRSERPWQMSFGRTMNNAPMPKEIIKNFFTETLVKTEDDDM